MSEGDQKDPQFVSAKKVEAREIMGFGIAGMVLAPIAFIVTGILVVTGVSKDVLWVGPVMLIAGLALYIIGKIMQWVYEV
jgi:hypothetical protein